MDIKNLLDEEIERLLSHIKTLGYGTDERKAAISELDRLYKLRIEETKNEQDYKKDCDRRAQERELHQADEALKREQMAQELKLHTADEKLKRDQMKADRDLHKAEHSCDGGEGFDSYQSHHSSHQDYLQLSGEVRARRHGRDRRVFGRLYGCRYRV